MAELGIIDSVLSEELAKRARLEAERDEAAEVVFPEQLVSRQNDPDIAKLMIGQQKLFAAKRATIQGKVEQLKQQIGQIDEQVQGILAQADAKERQIKLIGEELVGLLDLQAKGLVPNTRVLAMQRERARLEGERGELIATKASAESRVGEVKLQILQIREETLSETLAQLRETEATDCGTERTPRLHQDTAGTHDHQGPHCRRRLSAVGAHGWWGHHAGRDPDADRPRE